MMVMIAVVRVPVMMGQAWNRLLTGSQFESLVGAHVRMTGPGGDLRVVLNVTVPRHLSDEQRDVLQRFEELSTDKNYQPDEGSLDKLRAAFKQ